MIGKLHTILGEVWGLLAHPEGFEGVQGSPTLLTLAHNMLDLRYLMRQKTGVKRR